MGVPRPVTTWATRSGGKCWGFAVVHLLFLTLEVLKRSGLRSGPVPARLPTPPAPPAGTSLCPQKGHLEGQAPLLPWAVALPRGRPLLVKPRP